MKLIMTDLDGTLVDTNEVNYLAYSEALGMYGYVLERDYYYSRCNGRYYLDFLPEIATSDRVVLDDIHKRKKEAYSKYLKYAKLNRSLAELIRLCKVQCHTALVTTASKKNVWELLEYLGVVELFDLVLTRDDVERGKPDPQGYLMALGYFGVKPGEAIVFEDSDEGIRAALRAGCECYHFLK